MSYQLLQGDCIEVMRTLPAESVQCCVTSPPYFGLRDYGVDGQIGLEPDPEAYLAKLVEVFREVWRVLRNDGTLWLNLGDRATTGSGGAGGDYGQGGLNARDSQKYPGIRRVSGLKPKGPDRLSPGWSQWPCARMAGGCVADIIWHKRAPMPASVTDRPTPRRMSTCFLLSKASQLLLRRRSDP
jgi:hypothetical protein